MIQTCTLGNPFYNAHMSKIVLILLVTGLLVAAGCKSPSGNREYRPGKGWAPIN